MTTANKSNAVSKTKARVMQRKPKVVIPPRNKTDGGANHSPRDLLLGHMMEQHMMDNNSVSFEAILSSRSMNNRNTKWRNEWKALENEGLIEAVATGSSTFTSPYRLTERGIDESSTEEYKEAIKAAKTVQAKTNEEHHAAIKTKLMNDRGDEILDVLLKHEALSRSEIAAKMVNHHGKGGKKLGIAHSGAKFSYALQQLKDLGYAENIARPGGKGSVVRLTDKAFVEESRDAWFQRKRDRSTKEDEKMDGVKSDKD